MRRNTVMIDAAIAAILTILIVVLSPGLAVVGLIALFVLLVCGISFALDRRRRRKRPSRREPQLKASRREPQIRASRSRPPTRSPRRS